ncbi:MAG: anti-sigma factor [Pseudomonadota bacterium]
MSDEAELPPRPDDDALASEYVLGVLDADERRQCAERIARDAGFALRVAEWENRLSGLNEGFEEQVPPAGVKAAIDGRLFAPAPGTEPDGLQAIWASLAFWRILSGSTLAALVVLMALIVARPDLPISGPTLVAALAAEDTDARFLALYDGTDRTLRIRRLAGDLPADRDHELWLIAEGADPVSLGLVGTEDAAPRPVSDALRATFAEGVTLAVSLEPKGGSTTGAPTGPVVALGPVTRM